MSKIPIPHSKCNWVIENRILMGAYPREEDISKIIDVGINVFVNLTDIKYEFTIISNKIRIIDFPTPNSKVRNIKDTKDLLIDLASMYNSGKNFYIHCQGGIGRAGTICSCLYGLIMNVDAVDAITYVDKMRLENRPDKSRSFVPLPESNCQVKQIATILGLSKDHKLPDRSDRSYIKRLQRERNSNTS